MKNCIKCNELKPLDQFYYRKESGRYRNDCKPCVIAASKRSQIKNKDHRREYLRRWVDENRESCREYSRIYYRQWRKDNPEKAAEAWRKHHRKKMKDPNYRVSESISAGIRRCIKSRKGGAKWDSVVGYSLGELVNHIERQFIDGMSWDNYGEWHIDHIIPIASFDFSREGDFDACWALTNLRPLWAADNIQKRDKIEFLV